MARKPSILASGEMELSTAELNLVIRMIDIAPLSRFDQDLRDRVAAVRQRFAMELYSRLTRVRRKGEQ